MVQDIAYEQLNIPGLLSTVFINVLSQQIKSKVNFDILHLKPIEFAQNCTVPCVFIIGKQDKLVYPKRVTQIFEAYKGKQKSIINSSGQHSSEREPHIIKQCQDFILQELRKGSINHRKSMEKNTTFVNSVNDDGLNLLCQQFMEKMDRNANKNFANQRISLHGFGNKYNFESCLDENRNEERVVTTPLKNGGSTNDSVHFTNGSYRNHDGMSGFGDKSSMADVSELSEKEYQHYLEKMNEMMRSDKF